MKESKIELAEGKYTVYHTNGTNLHAFRYGEPWQDLTGDGLMLALVQEIERLQNTPVPTGYKLLKNSTQTERSWPEDFSHENGNYWNSCYNCDRTFLGHKRRAVCKVCAI